MDVQLRPMTPQDADAVVTAQWAAFAEEARLYGNVTLPPQVETPAEVVDDLAGSVGVVAVVDGRLAGSVRVKVDGRTLHIGRMAVTPDLQGRGIGAALLAAAEAVAPADEALLFTGHLSARNLRLYEHAGYVEQRRARVDDQVELVYLRKSL